MKKDYQILSRVQSPRDLKKVPVKDLPLLAEEIRRRIIDVTSRNGGHIAPSLGVVEITIALHYVLNAPEDKLLWDVGHQAYAHKILTGRNGAFDTLRQLGGLSGFPNRHESPYDIFTVGHSSTAISEGLGMACARDMLGEKHRIVCVVGDAALAGGMSFEALNNAGQMKKDIMIVLNDNEHSIAKTVGAMSNYLNRIMVNPVYNKVREDMQALVKRVPIFGYRAFRAARKLEEGLKNLLVPGILFEELGFRYFGPLDGHDTTLLINTFKNVIQLNEPRLVHVITKKGKGYRHAEDKPSHFHGPSAFNVETGVSVQAGAGHRAPEPYSAVFGRKLADMAGKDGRIVAVTAAMRDGTGLEEFASRFPERIFDVGIAEEHAVAFAGALARGGMKPVVAIYSTFLQRAYDQIIHDVSLQGLPVVFCVDRAGIVGEDGATHHGVFDIAFLRHIPNLVVMAPRDGFEMEKMMEFAFQAGKAVAIRYPRGSADSHIPGSTFRPVKLGESDTLRKGKDIAIIAYGSMVSNAIMIADLLSESGVEASVINARFVKPLDGEMIENITSAVKKIVTIEEGICAGGFGSAVLEFIERENIKGVTIKSIGLPDQFIEHGRREELLKKYHLTADAVCETILREMFSRE
ncbi:MAG: 1-deoxy-D-xylulose-5-phosphate synthase [Candidatus Omnitrophota bacterium]